MIMMIPIRSDFNVLSINGIVDSSALITVMVVMVMMIIIIIIKIVIPWDSVNNVHITSI